jgi:hypothetical protein
MLAVPTLWLIVAPCCLTYSSNFLSEEEHSRYASGPYGLAIYPANDGAARVAKALRIAWAAVYASNRLVECLRSMIGGTTEFEESSITVPRKVGDVTMLSIVM